MDFIVTMTRASYLSMEAFSVVKNCQIVLGIQPIKERDSAAHPAMRDSSTTEYSVQNGNSAHVDKLWTKYYRGNLSVFYLTASLSVPSLELP